LLLPSPPLPYVADVGSTAINHPQPCRCLPTPLCPCHLASSVPSICPSVHLSICPSVPFHLDPSRRVADFASPHQPLAMALSIRQPSARLRLSHAAPPDPPSALPRRRVVHTRHEPKSAAQLARGPPSSAMDPLKCFFWSSRVCLVRTTYLPRT
jgi:hypothetical protein